jgi:RND superfamily putative drug exporter
MFQFLGRVVSRMWLVLLAGWAVLVVGLWFGAPSWDEVGKSGQFAYLPADAPSRKAQALFDEAFPAQRAASGIVLVVTRSDRTVLRADDRRFVDETLVPRLRGLLLPDGRPEAGSPVARIRAPGDGPTGALLRSADGRAELVVIELNTEFLDSHNWPTVAAVERAVGGLSAGGAVPAGLDVSLTGSAVLGRDTGEAERNSAVAVQRWTLLVVVGLLLLVYRAPLLALVPLATVAVAIEVALRLLGLIAEAAHLNLYQGVRLYVTVVGYGAGVDYCLFLIARSREGWAAGADTRAGVREAVAKAGPAVTASAATVIIGIAMMGFADFAKIRQAGLSIAFGLAVVLAAALTLAPPLLCLTGRFILWPRRFDAHLAEVGRIERFWTRMGPLIARRPALALGATVALMAPFAVVALVRGTTVSYDLTRNVPAGAPSPLGLQKLREHFPAGATGPVTVLLKSDRTDFRTAEGAAAVEELMRRLRSRGAEFELADVRSLVEPLGTGAAARSALGGLGAVGTSAAHERAAQYYTSPDGHVTRFEVVLACDPFSESGLKALGNLERAVRAELPTALTDGTEVEFLGAAAGMRDLRDVTTADQWRVDTLVVIAVLVVLLVLLRRPLLCGYLILTVVFSFLTTLGLTTLLFAGLEPGPFPGLDWKVPLFLFTILVAVGEDYNIFLLTRVHEEEARHGAVGGVTAALGKTGGVLTSCGLIMAGTFASLFAASLSEMWQMGFALSCGVLLDALVVRPVLVPAFLLLRPRPHQPD